MSDTGTGDALMDDAGRSETGMGDSTTHGTGLRLVLAVPERCGLDEVLVGRVTLRNDGPGPVEVNGRLTLAEGDLGVSVSGPGGELEAGWPWPADSGARTVELAAGAALETGVLLLSTPTSAPLFPSAGRYSLVARYDAGPGVGALTSAPVGVTRTEPTTEPARADRRALLDRDVIQSVAAGGTMGEAGPALEDLASRGTGVTALLAALATGSASPAAGSAAGSGGPVTGLRPSDPGGREPGPVADPVDAAAALTAVLLPGDERRAEMRAALDLGRDARADAMLRAEPTSTPG